MDEKAEYTEEMAARWTPEQIAAMKGIEQLTGQPVHRIRLPTRIGAMGVSKDEATPGDVSPFALPDAAHRTPEEGEDWPRRDRVPFVLLAAVQSEAREYFADAVGVREVMTPEMVAKGVAADAHQGGQAITEDCAIAIYLAMRAAAPVEFISEGERHLSRQIELLQARNRVLESRAIEETRERDKAHATAEQHLRERNGVLDEAIRYVHEINALRAELTAARGLDGMIGGIEPDGARRKVKAEETDYNGPVVDGRTVPDPVHERVHEVVKDILAGRVIQSSRRQLQEALKNAPTEKKPFPTHVEPTDRRRIGL